jgi:AraC family transcriptional regulator
MKRRPVPVSMGCARFHTFDGSGCILTEAWFPPGATLPPHTHDRAILAVVLDGAIESSIARRRLDCRAASVWTEPLAERHANAVGRDGAHVLVVQPDPARHDLFDRFSPLLTEVSHRRDARIAADAARLAVELHIADDLSCFAIDALALAILVGGERDRRARSCATPPAWLRRAREVLHDRFRDHLSLAEVAAAAGVSPARFAQAFRRHFRCSPGEYVRELRVRWAADQLSGLDTAISRIAVRAGFTDQSHLTREFRRHFGVTPGAYRRATTGRRSEPEPRAVEADRGGGPG